MIEITPSDFYRLWILALAASENLYKGRELEYQKQVNEDHRLIEKVKLCYQLGVTACFEARQVKIEAGIPPYRFVASSSNGGWVVYGTRCPENAPIGDIWAIDILFSGLSEKEAKAITGEINRMPRPPENIQEARVLYNMPNK